MSPVVAKTPYFCMDTAVDRRGMHERFLFWLAIVLFCFLAADETHFGQEPRSPMSPAIKPQTAVVVPGVSPNVFPWDKHPVPPVLYKYLRPERIEDLTRCLIRFSQRQVFQDVFELRPEVTTFGNEEEIAKFMQADPVLSRHPLELREAVIKHVKQTPGREAALILQAQSFLTTPDEFAVLCLSEDHQCERMWKEYADHGRGFVVALDTTHKGFTMLRKPGQLGKVEYSDEPFPSFLSTYGAETFFRKRTRYQFEAEWRSIRAIKRFSQVRKPKDGPPIYLSRFDPECIREILITPKCSVEWELRTLAAIDARYRHVPVNFGGSTR
jgi:hypothetical protein